MQPILYTVIDNLHGLSQNSFRVPAREQAQVQIAKVPLPRGKWSLPGCCY